MKAPSDNHIVSRSIRTTTGYVYDYCECGATRITDSYGRTNGWHACALCVRPHYHERSPNEDKADL